jgi:hypothetical protein
MSGSYICDTCGKTHDGAPLSWGPDAPYMWGALTPDERSKRGELGTDQCVIDEKHFFVRGRIEIPVLDTGEVFAWLVWVEVSPSDFARMSKVWTVAGREKTSPMYEGRLANELPIYENPTLGLTAKLHTRTVGVRPLVELTGTHELANEQRNGISSHRVQEIADKLMGG